MKLHRSITVKGRTFYAVDNDVNGNPRYITFAPGLLLDPEKGRKIGRRARSCREHGPGIVFQSYNIERKAEIINELLGEE